MSMPSVFPLIMILIPLILSPTGAVEAAPEGPHLGKPLTTMDLDGLDIHVFPDGTGLPEGNGNSETGAKLYEGLCAACHGPHGTGGSAAELVGRSPLNGPHPDQSVGNYWPYATTLFDFIRRSMPLNAPRSLSADQVYALTAYILEINGLLPKGTALDKKTLPAIQMPNRDGFIRLWPESR
jgi:S-disulfanyl-L-cysteine oxidoreductase SoxD